MYHLNVRSKELANIAQTTVSLDIAHRRLGHTDSRQIRRMFTMKLVEGLNLKNTKEDHRICRGCAGGKMHKTSYRTSTSSKADCIAGRIHSDVCGPMPHTSLGGAQYFVIFKDEYSGWIVVNFMKSKAEVFNHLKTLHAFLKNQTSFSIKILRSDQGNEYTNAATTEWTKQMGILHEKSVTYTPQQNGTSERANRTVVESARSMMSFSKAPPELWGEAVAYAAYIRNRIPSGQKTKTPYEILFKNKPDISHVRIFGSKTFVHIPDVKRKKFDPKSLEGVLVGFCERTKGYRIFIPTTKKVEVSLDVLIDEMSLNLEPMRFTKQQQKN